jgi:hypothetical protein
MKHTLKKHKYKQNTHMRGGKTADDKIKKYRLNKDELYDCFGNIDITQQLHQREDLNQYIGVVNDITFTPKISVHTERSYSQSFSMRVSLIVEYIESSSEKQVAEFKIETDVPMTDQLKEFFIIRHDGKDKLVFHPLYFLFYQGTNDLSDISSCPSMGIYVDDDYEGIGFARNMIKLALIALQNMTNATILNDPENNFGGQLETQIISIDGDGSGGFWEHIGMYEDATAGYEYTGKQKRRCVGMEKIIPIIKMYNWAFSK